MGHVEEGRVLWLLVTSWRVILTVLWLLLTNWCDILTLCIFSFASKEEESGGSEVDYSEESSEEEEEMEKDRKTGNKFSLLQVDD